MKHLVSLFVTLFALWLLLSGYFVPLLLSLGVISSLFVVAIAARMDVVDHEGHPIHLRLRVVSYWFWLLKEIVLSNFDVARRILNPGLPISPTMEKIRCSQKSDLGRVIFANSITLTPGTVSVRVTDDHILVHSISREGMAALAEGTMDRRVSAVEGDH